MDMGGDDILPIKGSLDQPPIIIRQDKSILAIAAFLCLIAIFVHFKNADLVGEGYARFLGVVIIAALVRLIWPGSMKISPDGISVSGFAWDTHPWSDYERFALVTRRSLSFNRTVVGFFYSEDKKRGFPKWKTNVFSGADGMFPSGLVVTPQELVDLLDQAKAKWGT